MSKGESNVRAMVDGPALKGPCFGSSANRSPAPKHAKARFTRNTKCAITFSKSKAVDAAVAAILVEAFPPLYAKVKV
jgi:hypothetical protein